MTGVQTCALPILKHDWEIYGLMAKAMGYGGIDYHSTEEIWNELISLCHLYTGATYEKLAGLGYVQWPCTDVSKPGTPWLYEGNKFQTKSGKGLLFAAEWRPPLEKIDADYPLGLCTVREVGHYSCRSIDRKSTRLNSSHIPLSRMPSSA